MSEPSNLSLHKGSIRDTIRFKPDRVVVATILNHGSTRIFAVCLEPGQELASHAVPGDLTLQVFEGNPTLTVGDSTLSAAEGDVVIVPRGTEHAVQTGDGRAVVVGTLRQPA